MTATQVRVLIADDEPLARERLRMLLGEHPQVEVIGEAENGQQVLQQCEQLRPDLVLLDIAMPGVDGLETARLLRQGQPPPAVVFCTAYDQHALSAFDAAALDYLMKPVRPERLASALEKVATFLAGRVPGTASRPLRTHLCARLRGSLRLIAIGDIRYLQAEEKYVIVHHTRGEDLIEESLKSLEDEFADRLVRIHRNCLVARDELVELRRSGDGQVHAVLRNVPQTLEVSRRCVASLRDQLRQL
ncbi:MULTISPECIES: LytR/AlgR family response regulator transcription factor [Xanthomonas]|uniref:LytR/AlgR family response regulator transcription factor n=1 Tax=Xanthomonas TaxID=338 RepID=UPI0006E60CF3|nr:MULTISPECIES: LytTR family DNA-binding domain-containing protein [Xanthomonas]MBO9792169.1 response regulator transcription factor [Xanthomonas phaseoli pv. dieffenbachiae]MBO9851071.1 response regulator transcription factor [Xanthomonas phaseoli pv. dieffenbachiae]MBV6669219.1 LytTR family DNA-binding domain-containing protein [Xanthomonas euvesicatoria pv. alangii]MBV6830780.1 LytTR family DNA-binding domain-containing protein [Xanthomonas campestris pv. viegasii]MBV6861158.1 LytTR family